MKIYTKKGDRGETSLLGAVEVPKDDHRIRAYGSFDELNAVLGVVISGLFGGAVEKILRDRLLRVQSELFQLGAELATPRGKSPGIALLESSHVATLEHEIDEMEGKLKPLKNFILPGGSRESALLHFARTVCRRAERELVTLNRGEPLRPVILQYVNRLSDYLFVCARLANFHAKIADVVWRAPRA